MYILYYGEQNGELFPSMSDDKSCEHVFYELVYCICTMNIFLWFMQIVFILNSHLWFHYKAIPIHPPFFVLLGV